MSALHASDTHACKGESTMRRTPLPTTLWWLWFLISVSFVDARMRFINPPGAGAHGDFRGNPEFTTSTKLTVSWTAGPSSKFIELGLYQMNSTSGEPFPLHESPVERLYRALANETSYLWEVGTQKNLSLSNVFFLRIIFEGSSESETTSHYINIKRKPAASTDATTEPTTEPTAAPTSVIETPAVTTEPTNPTENSAQRGLPLATTAGIGAGVGIAAAASLGLVAWWCIGRRKKRNGGPTFPPTPVKRLDSDPERGPDRSQSLASEMPSPPPPVEALGSLEKGPPAGPVHEMYAPIPEGREKLGGSWPVDEHSMSPVSHVGGTWQAETLVNEKSMSPSQGSHENRGSPRW